MSSTVFRVAALILILSVISVQASRREHTALRKACARISQYKKVELKVYALHCTCHCLDKPNYLYDCDDVKYRGGAFLCKMCRQWTKCAVGRKFV